MYPGNKQRWVIDPSLFLLKILKCEKILMYYLEFEFISYGVGVRVTVGVTVDVFCGVFVAVEDVSTLICT